MRPTPPRDDQRPLAAWLGPLLLLIAMIGTIALVGCARSTPVIVAPPATTATPSPATEASGPVPLDELAVTLEQVAKGFDRPLFVTNAGDGTGRLYVVEQGGRISVIEPGDGAITGFLDVEGLISDGGERGLLGLAFSPDYADSGELYVNYTDRAGATVVARYTADDPGAMTPKLDGPEVLLRVEQPYANHNGGCLAFDREGRLWVGMGDGGSGGDPENRAQNPRSLLGKMLTLDVSQPNPRPRIAITGVRNPWRFSFDRATGDLWIADVGQNAWEEVHLLRAGVIEGTNLGWNLWEGNHPYPEGSKRKRDGFEFPVIEYGHDVGRSITGGYVYRGSRSPGLVGAYLYADFEAGWIDAARVDDATPPHLTEQARLVSEAGQPSSFGEDEAGEVYVCDYAGGTVSRIVATAPKTR